MKLVKATATLISTVFMLAIVITTPVALAQEEDDDLEPSVDTSAMLDEMDDLEPAVDTSSDMFDESQPAVSGATLAQGVTRRESSGGVMDEMTLGRTEVTGNQELPKVLYIVPWQKAEPGDLTGRPVNSLLDDVLAPIDREEFIRQVDYYDDLYGE